MLTSLNNKMKNDVLSLPPNVRAKLAHELIISLDEDIDTNVSHAWKDEINRRVSEIKSGVAKGRPAEQVLAEIRANTSRKPFYWQKRLSKYE